jgi:hypothetical protein
VILISSGLFIIIPPNSIFSIASDVPTSTEKIDNDFINGTFSNTEIYIHGNNTVLRLNTSISKSNNWIEKKLNIKPVARHFHAMATIWGTDKVLLYGGANFTGGFTIYDDTWIYDHSENNWTEMNPPGNPGQTYGHAMASIYGTDMVLLYKGHFSSWDNTWIYDLSKNNWTEKSRLPSNGTYDKVVMASVFGTDKVVLFGSIDITCNQTWIYDLSDNTWTNKTPKDPTKSPAARIDHAMASIYGTQKVLLYGGYFSNLSYWIYYNDTWIYDLVNDTWTQMFTPTFPNTRMHHSMVTQYGTDKVLLYGGQYSTTFFNETWLYDYSENTWTNLTPMNNPGQRSVHAMAFVYGTTSAVLFGGLLRTGSSSYRLSNETWTYYCFLFKENGTYISQPHNIGPNSSFKTVSWNASTSDETFIEFQLRSAKNKLSLNTKPFVGIDGTSSSYYTDPGSKIWSGHEGDSWIQYKAYFNTINIMDTPILKKVTIIYNRWPNTTLIYPTNEFALSVNKPIFRWNFTDIDSLNQSAFQVLIDDNPDFKDIEFDSNEQIANISNWEFPMGTNYIELPDGTWFWRVRTKDSDGDWGTYSEPWKFIIDTKNPNSEIVFPENNGIYNRVDTIFGNASDPLPSTELSRVIIQIKRIHDNYTWTGSEWADVDRWLLADGTNEWAYDSSSVLWSSGIWYGVCSKAMDFSNNIEPLKVLNNFIFDNKIPSSRIIKPNDGSWLNNLTSISGEAHDTGGSYLKKVEISIKRLSDNFYWSGSTWELSKTWLSTSGMSEWTFHSNAISWISGTQYIVQSRAIDNAGNIEIPSKGNMIIIDMEPPISIIENPLNNSFLNKLDTIFGTSIDPGGSGIVSVELSIKQMDENLYWDGQYWTLDETWVSAKGMNQWSFDTREIQWTTDTFYNIRCRAIDNVNNIELPGPSVTFMYDDTPPAHSVIINNDDEFTQNHNVELSLHAEDSGSGVSSMAVSANGRSWMNWEPYNSTKLCTLPTGDGAKEVFFKVQDLAGNIAEPVFDTIILDTTPPEKRKIVINDNAEFTKSELVLLNLSASDSLSGINKMAFSFDSKSWTPEEPFNNKKSMNLLHKDGKKTIYLKVNDKAGNYAIVSDSIILDTTPPHSLAITIIDMDLDSESQILIFSLHALDNLSGVDQMAFSFGGVIWSDWETFASQRAFILPPNNDLKIIYFKVKDKAGNTANPVSTIIPKEPEKETDGAPSIFTQYGYILLIIIILIIIVIIVIMVLKRKKKEVPEEQVEEAVTVKPGTVPEAIIPVGEMPATPKPEQLPETTTTQPLPQPITTPAPAPKLASPATPGQVPESQQISETAQVPQLPPVTTIDETTKNNTQEPKV